MKVESIFKTSQFEECRYVFCTTPRLEPKTSRSTRVPTKRVSQGLERGQKPYSESEFFFSRMHANQKNSIISVGRSDFDSRCKPDVSSSWMEFDFFFAIENSRSFKTVICSTNSSSHCLSRDAEHISLTAFRWRCDEVEMRGTCCEAQKSIQTKVVINFWKLYYDTEDTFTRNRTKGFFDIRRNKKRLLLTLMAEALELWSSSSYESWVIYKNFNTCHQDIRFLDFLKFKTSQIFFTTCDEGVRWRKARVLGLSSRAARI